MTLQLLTGSGFDASCLLLFAMAVGTLVGGSIWAGRDHAAAKRRHAACPGDDAEREGRGGVAGQEVLDISVGAAVAFVVAASAMLLLLFFFISKAFVYIMVFAFALSSSQAMAVWLHAAAERCAPAAWRAVEVTVPLLGPAQALAAASMTVSAVIGVTWAVCRNAAWSWVLQDALGVSLMLMVRCAATVSYACSRPASSLFCTCPVCSFPVDVTVDTWGVPRRALGVGSLLT